MYIYTNTYMYTIIINEKDKNLNENLGFIKVIRRRNGRGEM